MTLSDDELLRYHRQILLGSWDVAGQQALRAATVMVVGVGGLGAALVPYLAAAGVGRLILVDFDRVELTNLQRQPVHGEADVGRLKVHSAADRVAAINSAVSVVAEPVPFSAELLARWQDQVTVIADCCDNFASRDLINALAWPAGIPVVSAAAIGWQGQLSVFDPRQPAGGCYRCLYPAADEVAAGCNEAGVMAPTVAVIGSWQALEVMKLLAGAGNSLNGQLLLWDGFNNDVRRLRIPRDATCPVCHTKEDTR